MGDRTKIDWCDTSWNPVTGCLHGCEYCYARRIAKRFGAHLHGEVKTIVTHDGSVARVELERVELKEPYQNVSYEDLFKEKTEGRIISYPYDFLPTFHRYRLDEPQHWKKPRTIFVCSMADLFGNWVPDDWIREVVKACKAAPQHRYLFLTKNPGRIWRLINKGIWLPYTIDWWFGYTIDGKWEISSESPVGRRNFCSVEPLLQKPDPEMLDQIAMTAWCIIGAETGKRKGKVIPEKDWIDTIVSRCREAETPVFMKESLREIMGDDFVQEFPWEV